MVKAGLILLIYLFPELGGTWWWSALLVPLGGLSYKSESLNALTAIIPAGPFLAKKNNA
jgi:hypothetical protein